MAKENVMKKVVAGVLIAGVAGLAAGGAIGNSMAPDAVEVPTEVQIEIEKEVPVMIDDVVYDEDKIAELQAELEEAREDLAEAEPFFFEAATDAEAEALMEDALEDEDNKEMIFDLLNAYPEEWDIDDVDDIISFEVKESHVNWEPNNTDEQENREEMNFKAGQELKVYFLVDGVERSDRVIVDYVFEDNDCENFVVQLK